ncbi:MAG: hypothetical protein V1721_06440 [Pseudomonadota bacterium]
MKFGNKKGLLVLTAALAVFPIGMAVAVTTNLNATAIFLAALGLTPTNMQFGTNVYSGDPSGAADFVKLGTNGARVVGGVFTANGGAVVAGDVTITGTTGNSISVSCDATAVMGNGAGKTINIINIEVAKESATFAPGLAAACTGIGNNVLTFNLTSGTDDQLKVGGVITGSGASSPFASGAYSTATGGNDIQIDIVYT